MRAPVLLAALAAAAFAAVPSATRAIEIAEVHGDFYFDSHGRMVGHRSATLPESERRPMSHKEKFARMGLQLPPADFRAGLAPRAVPDKSARVVARDGLMSHVVVVKFRDDRPVRLRGDRLDAAGSPLPEVETILAGFPDAALSRAFGTEERILDENRDTGQLLGGKELADLNNYYVVMLPEGSADGADIANALNALDDVEIAYLKPAGELPACVDVAPSTPSYENMQFYRDPAPDGIDIGYAESYDPGGNGTPGYWVMDCESDWCLSHEDLSFSASSVKSAYTANDSIAFWHGTAVLGIIGACDNAYGVTGLTPDVTLTAYDLNSESTWGAVVGGADSWLLSGEIMLLEIQIGGPDTGVPCDTTCVCTQYELVPLEWDQSAFDAIETATANGVIVVEAAGNGVMDLDDPIFGNKFQTWFRDSGAIMVGAAWKDTHVPTCWSNSGSRVDVHAYGGDVMTAGYGGWFDGVPGTCGQEYTRVFGGTSAASPIIVGVCASVQGIAKEKYGVTITPSEMRSLIQVGGTPQGAGPHIGPMPDLVSAINEIEPDLQPYFFRTGWSWPAVPRSTADATGSSAATPAGALPGGGSTYFNWTEWNTPVSYTPTVAASDPWVFVSGQGTYIGSGINLAPGASAYWVNWPATIKGGRHTVALHCDYADTEDEWIETNNTWSRQYIWSGLPLTEDVPVVRSYDPVAYDPYWTGPWPNSEGFQATPTGGFWHAVAVTPSGSSTIFDVFLHTETPANVPQAGFGPSVAGATGAPGSIAWVAWDLNEVPAGTRWASVVNVAGTANKNVELESDDGTLQAGWTGLYTLDAGDLIGVHELFLVGGFPFRVTVEVVSGSADIGISVLDGTSGYHNPATVLPGGFADGGGAGQSETVFVNPTVSDYHGLVVWKRQSADVASTLTYNVYVGVEPNLVANVAMPDWDGSIVPRNDVLSSSVVDLPPVLLGNQANTYLNYQSHNEGPSATSAPWSEALLVDDAPVSYATTFAPLASGGFLSVNNAPAVGFRGGRHHLRAVADSLDQVAEFSESDNAFTDWFVWSPLDLAYGAPQTRPLPPRKDPAGWGPWYSCEGLRAAAPANYWSGVASTPRSGVDTYDLRMFQASTGSKDGFGPYEAWGFGIAGETVYAVANFNVAPFADLDYGTINWSGGTGNLVVQAADAPVVTSVLPGITHVPGTALGVDEILDIQEIYIEPEVGASPVWITLRNLSGGANLGFEVFLGSGGAPYYAKNDGVVLADLMGAGSDENAGPLALAAGAYYAVAVFKSRWSDLAAAAEWELILSTDVSPVDAPDVAGAPTRFALAAPTPNPFRGSAAVRFELPVPADVRLLVYDLTGRRVATLAEGPRSAGRHSVTWDGRNTDGRSVAAGVYFVRMDAPEFAGTRRITLLR